MRTLEVLELAKLLQAPAADQEQMSHLVTSSLDSPWWGLSDTMEALLAEHLFSGGLTEQNWAFLLTSPALGSPSGENVGVEAKGVGGQETS